MIARQVIRWQMEVPPSQATHWYPWQEASLPCPKLDCFFWPPTTPSILEKAFSLSLPRHWGWDLSAIPAVEQRAFVQAAKVYKRGVACRGLASPLPGGLQQGHYPINIYSKSRPLADLLDQQLDNAFVVVDQGLLAHWPALASKAQLSLLADERQKGIESVVAICRAWQESSRSQPWMIIGGGIIADTAAFAASLMAQPFTLIPTTLLAMADACVGGKTGVNAPPFGKNQIGSFAFPQAVEVWPGFLQSLSHRHLLAGGAECLKHAFLAGEKKLAMQIAKALRQGDLAIWEELLPQVIAIKAAIIAQDPNEQGLRVVLNLGHTLAHALEAICLLHQQREEGLLHGEAVGLGLSFALFISWRLGFLANASFQDMLGLLLHAGILLSPRQWTGEFGLDMQSPRLWPSLWAAMMSDKKKQGLEASHCVWVLLEDWGKLVGAASQQYTLALSEQEVQKIWQEFIIYYQKLWPFFS